MLKFELFLQKDGEYRFHLKAENGRIVMTSEGYNTEDAARNGIESVRTNASNLGRYDLIESNEDNKWYFNLRAHNGEIIGTSEIYESFENVKRGAFLIQAEAPKAQVKELLPA
jgi:uncharacterized protein YegP (UPF0339 family)